MFQELVDMAVRSVSTIFQNLWRSREIPEDWRKVNVTPIYEKGLKDNAGNYRPITHTLVPGEVMEWTFLGAATIQMKPNWEKSVWTHQGQIVHDQPDCSLRQSNFLSGGGTSSGPAQFHHGFLYRFSMDLFYRFCHCLLLENLMCAGLEQWSVGWVGTGRQAAPRGGW